jgi:hypothetical protein
MNIEAEVNQLWARVEAWVRGFNPATTLAPGATTDELATLERAIGRPLPTALRCSLLRHNGELYEGRICLLWHKEGYRLMSVAEIVEHVEYCEKLKQRGQLYELYGEDPSEDIGIPVAMVGTANMIWLTGEEGPLRRRELEGVEDVAPSYLAWLQQLAADLEAGRYGKNEYGSFDRALPSEAEQKKIVREFAREVSARHGTVDDVFRLLSARYNQPDWICRWCTSEGWVDDLLMGEDPFAE